MLLAPSKASYDDTETKKDFYALCEAINSGDDAFAKEVFGKYHVDSDHYGYFETDLDYAMDIDRDGVYMYEIIPARKMLGMRIYIVATELYNGWLTDFTKREVETWDDERFIAEAETQGYVWADMEAFMKTWNDKNFVMPGADVSVMRII